MDESEENMSTEDINNVDSPGYVKVKPKKRSLVERELETNLTARVTSPVTGEGSNTSRYGRARQRKTATDTETEKFLNPLKVDVSKQPQAYKMHASNSPISKESPKRTISVGSSIEDQIENIYNENISLSRFSSEEKAKTQSPTKKCSKVYIRKDLIQKPDTDTVVLIKNMFSPNKSNSHLSNILERSSEKYSLNGHGKTLNGFPDTASVVKTLDFDCKKKNKQASPVVKSIKKEVKEKVVSPIVPNKKEVKEKVVSKNELFELEAACEYQVGDLAWARVGTYPFWPCIVTREPYSDMFVKKKLFGRVERSVIHVTFFGDNGRRGWIVDNMLRMYHGRTEFEDSRDKFTSESKKKDPRLYAAHFVSEKKLPLWNVSVEEAETLMKEPKRLRIDALYDMLEKARAAKTTPSKREKANGSKITRTDSDVSLSESLYDTLFSEDDGKSDENRSKRARNKSLDVSEVVTACLDNMAAKSGIIQIQRQSHMDRWLQKAKSKTPEKIQPKLHVKVERQKRKDKTKKKKEAKLQKMKRNESLGSDINLLPYQNEHDYSSVNYENHDINESSNKNTDSASGLDSTLDTSTNISDIGVTVKIENLSNCMEDCSQEDIITTEVNDDIVMSDSENISKDNDNIKKEINHEDYTNNKQDNNNELINVNKKDRNKLVEIKEEQPTNTCDLTNTIQPRRSNRKRRRFEGINNSNTENKAKEPKLDLERRKPNVSISTPNVIPLGIENQDNKSENEVSVNLVPESNALIVSSFEKETPKKGELESTEPMSLNSNSELVNDDLINHKTTPINNNASAITEVEKKPTLNIVAEPTEHMLCDSEPTPDIVIQPQNSEHTETQNNIPTVPNVKEETLKISDVESTDHTIFINETALVADIEPLNSGNTTRDTGVPSVKNVEETFFCEQPEIMEHVQFSSKSKPVVVIEQLNTAKNFNLDYDACNTKVGSTGLKLLINKSKPVVVIKPLSYEHTATENNVRTVANLEKDTYPNSHLDSMELIAFHKSSKPVVVIEPLNINGLETQFIIKESKNKLLDSVNKNNIIADILETSDLSSDLVQNDASSILTDVNHITKTSSTVDKDLQKVKKKPEITKTVSSQLPRVKPNKAQGNVLKDEIEKTLADSERMVVDKASSTIVAENNDTAHSISRSEITNTKLDLTVSRKTKSIDNQPLIEKNYDQLKKNMSTNIVIGEETYMFDRTLSQDYDEIDGDGYDEYSHLPPIVIKSDSEKAILVQNCSSNNELTITEDSRKSKCQSTEKNPSTSSDMGSMIVKNILELPLDNANIQHNSRTLDINKTPTVTGDVSSIVNEENDHNQVSQENNDKCVFLDQSIQIADAASAESTGKKRKSPRLSLNRTRNGLIKLKNMNDLLEAPKISIGKVNTDPDKSRLETASVNSNDYKLLIRNTGSLKERRDSKKSKCDPEFVKYVEIHQDALLDEKPDLTQDEIETYLYQNWLYEESKKSDVKKIDDNEQSNLVKDFVVQQAIRVKKKPKIEKVGVLKNLDIRDILHKSKGKPSLNKAFSDSLSHEQTPQHNNDLQTVLSLELTNTEPEETVKATSSINFNDRDKSTTRRSRRSKDKYSITNLKEKETQPNNSNIIIKITKRPRSSKERDEIKHTLNTENCARQTAQICLNDTEASLTNHKRRSIDMRDTKNAMDEPEFVKYMEMHQDALLDEQPNLPQDEIVSYLYQNWLYEKGNNTKIKNIDDNQESNVVEAQETAPHLKRNLDPIENNDTQANTDSISRNDNKPEIDGSLASAEEKPEMGLLNDSDLAGIKQTRPTNKKKYTKETTNLDEKRVKKNSPNNCKDTEMVDTKRIGHVKEIQDNTQAKNEPEFIKYLEMHQDALLDKQPDLTQDEIVTYLYQNWLYEEDNKSEIKKIDDNEQCNLVKDFNQVSARQPKKIKKKSYVEKVPETKNLDIRNMYFKCNLVKDFNQVSARQPKKIKKKCNVEKVPETKNLDIRNMFQTSNPVPSDDVVLNERGTESLDENNIPGHHMKVSKSFDEKGSLVDTHSPVSKNLKEHASNQIKQSRNNVTTLEETKKENESTRNTVLKVENVNVPKNLINPLDDAENKASISLQQENNKSSETFQKSHDIIEDMEFGADEIKVEEDNEGPRESSHTKIINGFIEFEENCSKSLNHVFDPETASMKSEDSGVSITRKGRKEKDAKKSMEDPEFLKYLEARQDALIEEQPDLTHEEIVTYLYQTWFYEESTKSDVKKSDETEQSNLVKGLNQEPAPEPKKIKKKPKVEKEPTEKVKSTDVKTIKVEKPDKVLKNADIRDMIQKPKRKATQSKPYYNEEDSDLEEEDLETFKIFDRDEQNEDGEEIDEVELYFEQLTKPKPNVFKGYVRERVCEICYRTGNLVKCKSCHGMYHVECVKKDAEATEVAGPTRGRKKKRGRKPKGYDPSLETGSQSDERSQDANNSEEINISIEDEAESHIVIDEENFETLWENKMKELQSENQEEYLSDQEIDWAVEPGHCEIVDLKHKEKPIQYSNYKCNKCLKYETPVCFVCQSNKSPKTLIEVRQKCQVAHCHRYYHLECLDHWPQTQFNSWEPSKTNKKQIDYIETLSCPRHVCHTCVSDDPRGCKTRFCGDKLARCVKCPATYHSYTKCLPAGTQILTGSQIICPRHYEHRPGKVPCHVNTGWCFICALGGTLICCEYCPTSFHAECLNIKPPEGSYMCEDCETGRLPLYGEMVWVKLGHYRWWPGIVLHPTEIPENILAVKHSQGEFVVRFFGQYDHYWVNRGRVFPFQEGDSGRISSQKSKIDAAFTMAMEHAQRACEILKNMQPNEEEDLDIASSLLPPHYVKLKVNKPVGSVVRRDVDANSLTQCDCDPNQPEPCGPYSHCLNRMLLTECGPLCRAGERCHNRAFERRRYPRLQPHRAPHRGWGLRALEDIKQGQFVIEYVGELIDMEEFRRRMCWKHEIRDENFYFLTLDKERMIDAGPKGNLARFMNHCCEPNCETQKWTVLGDVRVGLFALHDIPANSEVTFNYNLECAGIEKKRCLCGAARCSGYIGAKPKQLQEDKPNKSKPPTKRAYKKRKPVEEPIAKPKTPRIRIKPIKPRELTEIEKDLLIIKNATNGMSSDSDGSRLSVEDKNPKALKRKRVSFSTDEFSGKKPKIAESESEAV